MRAYIKEEIACISSNIKVFKKEKNSEIVNLLLAAKELLENVNTNEIVKENIIWNLNKVYGQFYIKQGAIQW